MVKTAIFAIWIILFSISAPLSSAQEKKISPPPETVPSSGYPVLLGDQILFYLKEDIKEYSAEERANTISERIKKIAEAPQIPVNVVTTSDFKLPITLVAAGDKLLLPIFDQDALATGLTREQLAKEYAEKLRTALEKYRTDRSRERILYGTLSS
jgi:hypothetical protein